MASNPKNAALERLRGQLDDALAGLRKPAQFEYEGKIFCEFPIPPWTDAPRMEAALQLCRSLAECLHAERESASDANGGATAAKTEAASIEPGTKRGPHFKYPWSDCKPAVMKKLEDHGAPSADDVDPNWRRQKHLERYIAECMGQRGHYPGHTAIRDQASAWLREFKKAKAGN